MTTELTIISTSTGEVGTVNTGTGNFTPIADTGPTFFDIAFDGTNLWGVDSTSNLYKINPATGVSTFIGNTGVFLNALGFDDTSTLFGTGDNGFYQLNTDNGNATLQFTIPDYVSSGDIAFDPSAGLFYGTSSSPTSDTLFSIATDGTTAQLGSIGFGSVFGLAFEEDTLFGYTSAGQQITIDPSDPSPPLGTFDSDVTGQEGSIFGAAVFEIPPFFLIEAEELDLDTYLIENNSFASGGELISLRGAGPSGTTGTASGEFTGPSGLYDIVVGYFDDNDGDGLLRFSVNDNLVDNWSLDQDLGFDFANDKTFQQRTIGGVELNTGDTLAIQGTSDVSDFPVGDFARVDFFKLLPRSVFDVGSEGATAVSGTEAVV